MILHGKLLNIQRLLKALISTCIFFAQRKERNIYSTEKWLQILEQPTCVLLEGGLFKLKRRVSKVKQQENLLD